MSVTINNMELIKADELEVSSLELGDLIGYDEDIVEVTGIESDSTGDNYSLELTNDFGESEIIKFGFDELVDWYVYLD